jgi:hypothetical protein
MPGTVADTPVWTKWTFTVMDTGDLTLNLADLNDVTGNNIGGPASAIYLYGGNDGSSSQNALTGLYVDNITLTVIPKDMEPPSVPTGLTQTNLTDTSVEQLGSVHGRQRGVRISRCQQSRPR